MSLIIALLITPVLAAPSVGYDRCDVADCLKSKSVPYADPKSANWAAVSTPYNLRLVYEPAVIIIPETPAQVSDAVTCAAEAGLKVQAKGGGHSYASFSSGGQNGSAIIDMEKFSTIDVDQSKSYE
jgi:FAD/FMN-containing dehydrogenase